MPEKELLKQLFALRCHLELTKNLPKITRDEKAYLWWVDVNKIALSGRELPKNKQLYYSRLKILESLLTRFIAAKTKMDIRVAKQLLNELFGILPDQSPIRDLLLNYAATD